MFDLRLSINYYSTEGVNENLPHLVRPAFENIPSTQMVQATAPSEL